MLAADAISCCAFSSNETSRCIVGWTLAEFCLTFELNKIFLYLRIHATTVFILLQLDINDSDPSKIPSFMETCEFLFPF